MAEKTEQCQTVLPISRIKTIMKSSPDVNNVGNDSLFMIAKATELFVQDLAQNTMKQSKNPRDIEYNDLAEIVHNDDTLMFLQDIIPQKIKAREYLESMNGRKKDDADVS